MAGLTDIGLNRLGDAMKLHLAPLHSQVDELRDTLDQINRFNDSYQLVAGLTAAKELYASLFRLPEVTELTDLARSAIGAGSIAGGILEVCDTVM